MTVWAAVVVTVIVGETVCAVPVAATDAGEKAHVVSAGRPEQARLIVPLKPVEFETVIEDVPAPPAAEIWTTDALPGIAAKKPGVIVKVIG